MLDDEQRPEARRLGPAALKAFAHPLRLRLYDQLLHGGPATATQLAQQLAQNTGATSYHLRELARHGLIVDDERPARGRERWWQVNPEGYTFSPHQLFDPDTAAATRVLLDETFRQRSEELARWLEAGPAMPREWIEVSTSSRHELFLTSKELADLVVEVNKVLDRHAHRFEHRKQRQPDGAVLAVARVRAYFDAFPVDLEPFPHGKDTVSHGEDTVSD